jgi:hypothetical protein
MKIRIPGMDEIDRAGEIEVEGVYCGLGIKTEDGYFGICERDWGIEITVDGKLVASVQNGVNGKYVKVYGWDVRKGGGKEGEEDRATEGREGDNA